MKEFIGTGVALITPFDDSGAVDTKALEVLVNYNIDNGTDYLVVMGTTAEAATLSTSEKETVKTCVTAANKGRVPQVLGVGGNNTAAVVSELQSTDLTDFDAILSVSPYYNKPSQEGIYQHFAAVSRASSKPIILYNVPGRTSSNMAPQTVARLARDFENIIAIKEAVGEMVQIMELIRTVPKDFLVISGEDITTLPTVLAGGAGVISVLGQGMPKEYSKMIRLGLAADVKAAFALHYKLMPIISMIFEEGNPAGIKALLHHKEICKPNVRLPLVSASADLSQRIGQFLDNY